MVCEEFQIKKSTFYDIKKAKEKIRKFALSREEGWEKSKPTKRIKSLKYDELDAAVYKWYKQERAVSIEVRGIDIQDAAMRLAEHLGIEGFKSSCGWLFRFRNRHCIGDRRVVGESKSADLSNIDPFRRKLTNLIKETGLLLSQVYNADETGLYWRAPPSHTQAPHSEKATHGRKVSKDRISALMCANADGSHRLKLCVVGKYRRPRCLKNIMDSLPLHYYNNKSAWFDRDIFSSWFYDHAIPEIYKDQIERQKISRENVKALILIDNAPAHPSGELLSSKEGNIKIMFLPPNTTSVIQPMDQGVIECCKRFYRTKLMRECFVVLESEEDKEEDTRGARTLQNLKDYNLHNALFNLADAWQQVSVLTLANAWKKLIQDMDVLVDFTGFEPEDFVNEINNAGAVTVTEEDVVNWLEVDADDPGYHHMTEAEIAESVVASKDADESEEEEMSDDDTPKLGHIRQCMDDVLKWLDRIDDRDFERYYTKFRDFRNLIITRQHAKRKQRKIHDFFKPMPPRSRAIDEPGTSSDSSGLHIHTSTDDE